MKKIQKTAALLLVALFFTGLFPACAREAEPIRTRDLTWAVSTPLPEAEDFAVELPEGYRVRYAEDYTYSELREYRLELIVTDPEGREVRQKVKLELVLDKTPPTIHGLRDLLVSKGGSVSYLTGVSATDNCHGKVTLSVDTSEVDLRAEGVYPVRYTATDAAGNSTTVRMSVAVYRDNITEEMLWERLDPVINRIITKSMTVEEQARAVYEYVYYHIDYVSTSDKSSWVRAAYEGLRDGEGDCYTYFALSKAFFERLGIENRDVQRTQSAAAAVDERHFWNFVNIGSAQNPRWYHFDACRIRDNPAPWGCLMTDAQLAEYSAGKVQNGVSDYFYAYDRSSIPKSADTVITPIS